MFSYFPLIFLCSGLAAPLVAQKLLGTVGEYSMLFLILMAVMSTGSAEVIAVASIIIYDVYQAYVCPFRWVLHCTVQYSTVPGLRVPLQAGAGAWAVHPVRRLAPATPPSPSRATVPVCQC